MDESEVWKRAIVFSAASAGDAARFTCSICLDIHLKFGTTAAPVLLPRQADEISTSSLPTNI